MIEKKVFFNQLGVCAAISAIIHHIKGFKKHDYIGSLIDIGYLAYYVERLGKNGVYKKWLFLKPFVNKYVSLLGGVFPYNVLDYKFFLQKL